MHEQLFSFGVLKINFNLKKFKNSIAIENIQWNLWLVSMAKQHLERL